MIPRELFTDTHETYRDAARRFIAEHITPNHDDWEREGQVSRMAWRLAGEHGFLCGSVPEEYGGPGADFLYGAIFLEELSKAGATGPGFHLHSEIVAPYICRYGSDAQKQRWLPDMVTGGRISAIAMTDRKSVV